MRRIFNTSLAQTISVVVRVFLVTFYQRLPYVIDLKLWWRVSRFIFVEKIFSKETFQIISISLFVDRGTQLATGCRICQIYSEKLVCNTRFLKLFHHSDWIFWEILCYLWCIKVQGKTALCSDMLSEYRRWCCIPERVEKQVTFT